MMEIVNKNYLALGDSYTIGEAVPVNEAFFSNYYSFERKKYTN